MQDAQSSAEVRVRAAVRRALAGGTPWGAWLRHPPDVPLLSSIIPNPPTKISRLRSAIETDDPITERISVVSVVMRLRTSPVRIVS